ncbi:4199_t:CDS:2, partial [Acaulospora colombiana]
RDGFTPKAFYKICNQQANTVVVLKVNGTGEILGGYNPNPWDKQQYRGWNRTEESFVFSFGATGSILSRVTHPEQAIFESYFDGNGPNFGGGVLRMKDNFKEDKSCVCMHHKGYERPIRTSKAQFSVDEYESITIKRQEGFEKVERKGIIIDKEVLREVYLKFCEGEPRISAKYRLVDGN